MYNNKNAYKNFGLLNFLLRWICTWILFHISHREDSFWKVFDFLLVFSHFHVGFVNYIAQVLKNNKL